MTVLDSNFIIDILRDEGVSEVTVDMIDDPKTTIINVFELYFGARLSVKQEENISNINTLLKSIKIIDFDRSAAAKAADIHAKLNNYRERWTDFDVAVICWLLAHDPNELEFWKEINF